MSMDNCQQLYDACTTGNAIQLQQTIEQGVDVNTPSLHRGTPLMLACKSRVYDCVQILIEHEANVNSEYGFTVNTALHVASKYGTPSTVQLLLKNGADVDKCDGRGRTALFYTNNAASLCALIEAGADVNIRDHDGNTALHGYKQGFIVVMKDIDMFIFGKSLALACIAELMKPTVKAAKQSESDNGHINCRIDAGASNTRSNNDVTLSRDITALTTDVPTPLRDRSSHVDDTQIPSSIEQKPIDDDGDDDDDDWVLVCLDKH